MWNYIEFNREGIQMHIQVNWSTGAANCPSSHGHSHHGHGHGQLTPSYTNYSCPSQTFCPQPYSATYSFAADFRPPESTPLEPFRPQWVPNPSSLISPGASLPSSARTYPSPTLMTSRRQKSTSTAIFFTFQLRSVSFFLELIFIGWYPQDLQLNN